MTPAIPRGPGDLSPAWLSAALGREVTEARVTRIGEDESFTGGGLYRVTFPGGTVVAKLAPADPALRASFARANARETRFYGRFSAGLPVPQCHFGGFDPETGASALLLADLQGHRARKFLEGFDGAEAAAAMRALARVHAAWWQAPELSGLPGLDQVHDFDLPGRWAAYPAAVAGLLPDVALPPAFLALGDHVAANPDAVFSPLLEDAPVTLLHRDCHADNILFGTDGAATLLDWQLTGKGRGTWDAAYALVSSMTPDMRRRHETELLGIYHQALLAGGVTGYDWQACQHDYRRAAVGKLFVTVVATVLLDNAAPAKVAWRRADLERLLAFCADHDVTPGLFKG